MDDAEDDLIPDPTPSGFRGYLTTLPRWKKFVIGGAASSFALALVTVFLEDGSGSAAPAAEGGGEGGALRSTLTGEEIPAPKNGDAKPAPAPAEKSEPEKPSKLDEFLWGTKRRQGAIETAAKSATRTVANGLGRQILRGILGGIFGGKR